MKELKENINEEITIEGATCDACESCSKVDPICQCWEEPNEEPNIVEESGAEPEASRIPEIIEHDCEGEEP